MWVYDSKMEITSWHDRMNSSRVTTPSLFLSIFCREKNTRRHFFCVKRHSLNSHLNRKLRRKKNKEKPTAFTAGTLKLCQSACLWSRVIAVLYVLPAFLVCTTKTIQGRGASPERRHPRVVWVRRSSGRGRCTSPSCRILLVRCPSSPVRSTWVEKWRWKCEKDTMTHNAGGISSLDSWRAVLKSPILNHFGFWKKNQSGGGTYDRDVL